MMSLLPYYYEDFDFQYPRRLMDQHFMPVLPRAGLDFSAGPLRTRKYYRSWRQLEAAGKDLASRIIVDGDKFEIILNAQHFVPEEIMVKTADGYIVVEGKHEEEDERGYICQQFVRRYLLPKSALAESVESRFSFDGVLMITALMKLPDDVQGEKMVPVAHIGPVKDQSNVRTGLVGNETKDQSNEYTGAVHKEINDQSNVHTGPVRKDIKDQSNIHTGPVRKEIKDQSNKHTGAVRKEIKDQSNEHTGVVHKDIKDQNNERTGVVRKEIKDQSFLHTGAVRKEIKDYSNEHTGPVRKEIKDQNNVHTGAVRKENKDQSNRTEGKKTN